MQIGAGSYKPRYAAYLRYATDDQVGALLRRARVMVAHAGVGSILAAAEHGLPVILVPRRKRLGEHVDDHQLEVAHRLSGEGRVIAVYDLHDLPSAIGRAALAPVVNGRRDQLVRSLRHELHALVGAPLTRGPAR
jgi:UDP-N-acetylglucosamine transferase subunit ALG13